MLELKKGVDILSTIGAVKTADDAQNVFKKYMDSANLAKIARIKNEEALLRIANAIAMCDPRDVFVIDGSAADIAKVKADSLAKGEEKPLAMKNHTIHFDLPQDQGRLRSKRR